MGEPYVPFDEFCEFVVSAEGKVWLEYAKFVVLR